MTVTDIPTYLATPGKPEQPEQPQPTPCDETAEKQAAEQEPPCSPYVSVSLNTPAATWTVSATLHGEGIGDDTLAAAMMDATQAVAGLAGVGAYTALQREIVGRRDGKPEPEQPVDEQPASPPVAAAADDAEPAAEAQVDDTAELAPVAEQPEPDTELDSPPEPVQDKPAEDKPRRRRNGAAASS